MYHQHFGLNEAPFSIAVNPRYLFMSQRHRDALAHLLYGVSGGGGFILLTGEVGTGKTTVNRCLLEQLPDTTDLAIILNPALSAVELLATACDELKIDYPQGTESLKALTDALHRYLLDNHERGRKTVLMIDEAQHLDFDVLEQIRLLTNLETNDEKLLQIILIGQPELTEKLSRPELRQLNQRITARYNLQPLNLQETTAYIRHRLEVAGLRSGGSLFESAAVKQIHTLTRGIPRLINVLCDRALLGAYGQQRSRVNKKLIAEAAAEVFGEKAAVPSVQSNVGKRALLALLVSAVSAVAGYWVSQSDVSESDILARGPASDLSTGLDASVSNADDVLLGGSSRQPSQQSAVISRNKLGTEVNAGIGDGGFSQPRGNADFGQGVTPAAPAWELRIQEANERFWQAASSTPVPSTVCPPPKITGLSCSKQAVNVWNDVMSLNRPVLLEMVTKDKFAAAALVLAFGDATALTWTRQGILEVPLGELADSWTGGVQYLWQAPQGWIGSVGLGNTSPVVNVIAQMFATLDGMAAPNVASFGPALEARVRLFQESEGIAADGVVGEQTILRLNDRLGIGLTSQRALERSSMWVTQVSAAGGYPRGQR
ncbi:type II secretory pathway, component ExeA (putative ATPase) [gamma proteobacterium HIMB55]|nr:type II secretory pathway, component ExeA (putative ATPase) [gamma proteobacterium HIMB55]